MAARASSLSLYLPDICYIPFRNFLTSQPRIPRLLMYARGLREIHPVQE